MPKEEEVEDCKLDGDDGRFGIIPVLSSSEVLEYFMLLLLLGKSILNDGT